MDWIILIIAGLLEVVWASSLKYTEGFTKPVASLLTLAAIIASFILLAQALKTLPVGTGYAVWTGIGVVGTAIVGSIFLGESRLVSLFFRALDFGFLKPLHRATQFLRFGRARIIHDTNLIRLNHCPSARLV